MKFLWIFEPDAVWCLIPMAGALWALGGSGAKALRHILVPALIAASACSLGASWWISAISLGALFAVLTIPYGDDIKKKLGRFFPAWLFVVGALYAAGALPLAFIAGRWLRFGLGCGISSVVFGALTLVSQRTGWPRWKFVEIALGMCLGLQAAWLLP